MSLSFLFKGLAKLNKLAALIGGGAMGPVSNSGSCLSVLDFQQTLYFLLCLTKLHGTHNNNSS
jgi:hypothetical protein